MTEYSELEPEPQTGWSPGAVVLVATMVLVLGLGGAVVGVYFANQQPTTPTPATTLGAGMGTAPPSATPTPSASPSPIVTPSDTSADFALPNVVGAEFREARTTLRALKLGVNVVFAEDGASDSRVLGSKPSPGETVHKGVTVKLTVAGTPPLVAVPNLANQPCSSVGSTLESAGLYPAYPSGRKGVVLAQDPAPDATDVHWNDKVTVTCGESSPPASPA